jgi:ATP-dependent RNA helicase DOB1
MINVVGLTVIRHAVQIKQLAKSMFEGSIVRAIRRLYELLEQLKLACGILGDADLGERLEQAGIKIQRDVVFAASLYL